MFASTRADTLLEAWWVAGGVCMHAWSADCGRAGGGARGAEDVLSADHELERGAPFCANPACALHVRLVDAHVKGGGNWVALPDGRIFGRGRFGNALLCDACGTRRGPVRIDRERARAG
ncbi:MAG: hypothetical protein WAK94_17815 [Steroidobacteraceae bacterium]